MESINDGDVVIVDHDLENQETQITDTPGKYSCGKFIIQSTFKVLAHHQRYNKGIIGIPMKILLLPELRIYK